MRNHAAQCLIRRQGPWNGIMMEESSWIEPNSPQMSVDELWTLHLEISDALLLLEDGELVLFNRERLIRPHCP